MVVVVVDADSVGTESPEELESLKVSANEEKRRQLRKKDSKK